MGFEQENVFTQNKQAFLNAHADVPSQSGRTSCVCVRRRKLGMSDNVLQK